MTLLQTYYNFKIINTSRRAVSHYLLIPSLATAAKNFAVRIIHLNDDDIVGVFFWANTPGHYGLAS